MRPYYLLIYPPYMVDLIGLLASLPVTIAQSTMRGYCARTTSAGSSAPRYATLIQVYTNNDKG